jgi:hypothetical protein
VEFFALIVFLVLYFLRPHEWMSGVATLKPVILSMALAVFGLFNRERGFSVKDIFKTPHDWLMAILFLWGVFTAPKPWEVFGIYYSLFVFYVVTVQALSNVRRLQKFLNWWAFMIFGISLLALASEYGFDPMGSFEVTHGIMKNRLVLNTSLFNNPNALGHSVVPCLMMLYYVCYWKRPIFSKIAMIPLLLIPLYCIYLTVSKGAFLSAFATLVLAYSFGRPKAVQITILVLAVTVGYGAMYSLPRMNELRKGRTDPAIQGRIAAWQFGLETMRTKNTGVGLGNFKQEFFKKHHYDKAGHSSYVQIGTEMGYTGFYIYLGIIYCCLRTLISSTTLSVDEERARRTLFVLICSFLISSWMVDFGFRATYFLMAGAIAAFHRLMLEKRQPVVAKDVSVEVETAPIAIGFPQWRPVGSTPLAVAESVNQMSITIPPVGSAIGEPEQAPEPGGIKWNRLGVIDLSIIAVMLWGAIQYWRYIMHNI